MNKLYEKAISLGFPHADLRVTICFTPVNSLLANKLNKISESTYPLANIIQTGVLIGKVGHLQLIEWQFVKDIF